MKLSIMVPFHNEEKNVPLVLDGYRQFFGRYNFELLCIDDASADGTNTALAHHLADERNSFARLIIITAAEHRGYGHAVMTGVRQAQGEIIAWTHSDLQTDPADVFRAYDYWQEQADRNMVVKGSRVGRTPSQIILSGGMAIVASVILHRAFFEINAQPKLFHRDFLLYLENAPDDFSLDLYLLYQAKRYGYRIATISVRFPERQHGQSSWAFSWRSKWKTIMRTIRYIWRLRAAR